MGFMMRGEYCFAATKIAKGADTTKKSTKIWHTDARVRQKCTTFARQVVNGQKTPNFKH